MRFFVHSWLNPFLSLDLVGAALEGDPRIGDA